MELQACDPNDSSYAPCGSATIGAIGDLYRQHHRKVYSLCLSMTRNTAEAEDLTQEVFVQLIRKGGSFRGESLFTTWLYRLTTNQVLMHFRKIKRRRERSPGDTDDALDLLNGTKRSSSSQVLDRLALEAALARLPSGCRQVLLLFDIEGYKHCEIADKFGCSVGNSKSQLHKARKKLRQLLDGEMPTQDWSEV